MRLTEALRIEGAVRLALVGAGGKTSTLFTLARELPPPVLLSASTHLAIDETKRFQHCLIEDQDCFMEGEKAILLGGVHLFTGNANQQGVRTAGLSMENLESLYLAAEKGKVPLLVEADGSRRLPIKAPGDHEPPIPPWVDLVGVLAGLSGLGVPVDSEHVFRVERFLELSGLDYGEALTPASLVKVLLHPAGGLKNIPVGAKRAAILNQADSPALRETARKMAESLLDAYDAVLVSSHQSGGKAGPVLSVYEPIAGIVLAAGGASRYGEPKVLLEWNGKPLIRHVVETALQAGLKPVHVVLGAVLEPVRRILSDLPVVCVVNDAWESGQSSSVKVGIESLPETVGGALMLMADQPQIPSALIHALVEAHAHTLAPVTLPSVQGRQSSPVLMDRNLFGALIALSGDVGGRALFKDYQVLEVPWNDAEHLFDVDTPQDYQRLQNL